MKYVKKICDDNKLRYFICSGTLIGAVRHKGFIPWDDDIDMALPRNDYMELVNILKDGQRYRILTFHNNEDYYYPYAKIVDTNTVLTERGKRPIKGLGVCIDVFPIDGLPRGNLKIWYHMNKLTICRLMLYLSLQRYPKQLGNVTRYIIKCILWPFSKAVGWKRWIRCVDRLGTKYDYNHGDKVGCIVGGYFNKEIVSKKVFEKAIVMEFEGETFPAPVGYDEYLTSKYGNYMEFPPEKERVPHHGFEAYLKDNSIDC